MLVLSHVNCGRNSSEKPFLTPHFSLLGSFLGSSFIKLYWLHYSSWSLFSFPSVQHIRFFHWCSTATMCVTAQSHIRYTFVCRFVNSGPAHVFMCMCTSHVCLCIALALFRMNTPTKQKAKHGKAMTFRIGFV